MSDTDFDPFLRRLLDAPGPSGFEAGAARVWRAEAETFADEVAVDIPGNSRATVNANGTPRVLLAGHIDEIGLIVTHIDDDGFLYVAGIGGWDPQVLVGQRLRILTRTGEIPGVIGKKPIHLMKSEEREKASKVDEFWIDVGAKKRAEVVELGVRVGDPAVIDADLVQIGNGRFASRSIDNRIGAFVVLEALRRLATERDAFSAAATAVASTQEEIGSARSGASALAFALEPDAAIVVDVTFATDTPGAEKKAQGDHALGSGPVLTRGSASHPLVVEQLLTVAEREGIPFTLKAEPRATHTDADHLHLSRGGIATGLISIPNRYMHSPNEIVSLDDVENTIRLIVAWVQDLEPDTQFVPR